MLHFTVMPAVRKWNWRCFQEVAPLLVPRTRVIFEISVQFSVHANAYSMQRLQKFCNSLKLKYCLYLHLASLWSSLCTEKMSMAKSSLVKDLWFEWKHDGRCENSFITRPILYDL